MPRSLLRAAVAGLFLASAAPAWASDFSGMNVAMVVVYLPVVIGLLIAVLMTAMQPTRRRLLFTGAATLLLMPVYPADNAYWPLTLSLAFGGRSASGIDGLTWIAAAVIAVTAWFAYPLLARRFGPR